jgi:transcriptional regulator with XRE-family HTH domain
MIKNDAFKAKILNFKLATHNEICKELGRRLREQRLARNLKQKDLADRAGVAVGTVKNLESKGLTSLETLIRVVVVIDLVQELERLFLFEPHSIDEMEKLDQIRSSERRRAR